jgi:CBS domain containing-hemolysin-like protein
MMITEGYSRMPVYDDVIDKIIGIVHAKDILPLLARNEEIVLKDIIRKPYFIPETKKINDLMAELQQKRIQIAIVLTSLAVPQVWLPWKILWKNWLARYRMSLTKKNLLLKN